MKQPRTTVDVRAFWLAQAERYERFAAKCLSPAGADYWRARAHACRTTATAYPTPA